MIKVVLGLLAGAGVLYVQGRATRSQVEALRAEIALARIEGVLAEPPFTQQA